MEKGKTDEETKPPTPSQIRSLEISVDVLGRTLERVLERLEYEDLRKAFADFRSGVNRGRGSEASP